MNQAILITAYKNPEQINDLINFFPQDEVNIYIHIDEKSSSIVSKIKSAKNIFKYSFYDVKWGSFNHTRAILFLSAKALRNRKNSYFHLISGEDYPCVKDFLSFKERLDPSKNYLEYFKLPYSGWHGNGGLDRVNMFHLYDVLNARDVEDLNIIYRFYHQKHGNALLLPRKSFYEEFDTHLYGGSTWWSLSREVLDFVSQFTQNNPSFLNRFRNTCVSEELYFQTIILNSPLSQKIENNNLRYIDWETRGDGVPCYLDESDFDKMTSDTKLFARKLSLETIKKFNRYLK